MNNTDLFEEFSNKCLICKTGYPELIDDTDNPNRVIISSEPIATYRCTTCNYIVAGYVKRDGYMKVLDDRWVNIPKDIIAWHRFRLGISNIANRLSADSFYFCHQMIE